MQGNTASTAPAAPRPRALRIVGLGASAGGLGPLQAFLGAVPPASGLAFVVVQHLDPVRKALLVELLQRVTPMRVQEVTTARVVEPEVVYVIAPGTELTLRAGVLRARRPARPRGQSLPIDALFASLARELGPGAIGVVLSGMGADGARGLAAIAAAGGATLVQDPVSAQFDAMPRAAIASAGDGDAMVAPPAEMPARIAALAGDAHDGASPPPLGDDAAGLAAVLELLHQHTRHDFTLYKSSTLVRRIARRMAIHGVPTMAGYVALARGNAQELDLLFREMLIGVTSFFRDPEVWHELAAVVWPALIAHRRGDEPLRAWVAGCSTGEEAYSLAMSFVEAVEALAPLSEPACRLQVFATDLNADAVALARLGRYPASIARTLAPPRLARFFSPRSDGYQVEKRLRDMVLFTQHDVLLDPPFTRLDLLACRNVMIYFGGALQRRLVPLFHYALRPGGALLLGNSETVGRASALFMPLHPKSRLYWRGDNGGATGGVVFPTRRRPAAISASQETPLSDPAPLHDLQSLADGLLLQAFAPPAVVVNEAGDIVHVHGRTGRFLEPAAGKANWNLHVMARPALQAPLAGALRRALQEQAVVELRDLRLEDDDPWARVDVTVQPVAPPRAAAPMALVVFRDAASVPHRRGGVAAASAGPDAALLEDLARSRGEILALREEMRASREELQAANEELQSANEELQSANEELTTSREEAQSMNEELQTINGELQSKLDDLALAQSDMQNLLDSTHIATLFLDKELNVRRFTEQIVRVVPLRAIDVGRPFAELASTLIYPELHEDARATLRTLAASEKEVATRDGLWFMVRVMPYRTLADVIEGVVITFIDITVAKQLEARLRKA